MHLFFARKVIPSQSFFFSVCQDTAAAGESGREEVLLPSAMKPRIPVATSSNPHRKLSLNGTGPRLAPLTKSPTNLSYISFAATP